MNAMSIDAESEMSKLLSRISSLDHPHDGDLSYNEDSDSDNSRESGYVLSSNGDKDIVRADAATEASLELYKATVTAGRPPANVGDSVCLPIPRDDVSIADQDTLKHTEIMQKYMADMISSCQMHFMEVKRRLLDEKDFTVRSRDVFYTEHLTRQQQIIEKLNLDLTHSESEKAYESHRLNLFLDRTLSLYGRRLQSHVSEFSSVKVFYRWKAYTADRTRLAQMVVMANKFMRRSILAKAFSAISKEYYERVITKKENESKFRFEGTARVMVERYEGEIARLQAECREAQAALRQEAYRRQQLEEDLRRMFLKNMTVMNMEALSLFQSPNAGPPQLAAAKTQAPASIMDSVNAEYVSANKEEPKDQTDMKYQQQTLQQQRNLASAASELSRASRQGPSTSKPRVTRNIPVEDDVDAFPRAKLPPAPVRHVHSSEHKIHKGVGPRR